MPNLTSPLTPSAVRYTLRRLASGLGLPITGSESTGFEALELPVRYQEPDPDSPAGIYIAPCEAADWQSLLDLPAGQMDWRPASEAFPPAGAPVWLKNLPVLFTSRGRAGRPFSELLPNGGVVFNADLIASVFFLLSRWEEAAAPTAALDKHGRFPASASAAARHGFLDRPLVDELGLALGAWISALLPGFTPHRPEYHLRLTHDIDVLFCLSSLQRGWRSMLSDMLSGGPALLRADLNDLLAGPRRDPCYRGIFELLAAERSRGLSGTYFFMAARPSRFEDGYDPAGSLASAALTAVRDAGMEIGLHASYRTPGQPDRLSGEKQRLEKVLGEPLAANRQHYLRIRGSRTWQELTNAGFRSDSSLGFADAEGFRAGTCRPFPLFDLENDRELDLVEHPLIVMDASLRYYRKLTPSMGRARILQLAQACRRVGGEFNLLWHNHCLARQWQTWGSMYLDTLDEIR